MEPSVVTERSSRVFSDGPPRIGELPAASRSAVHAPRSRVADRAGPSQASCPVAPRSAAQPAHHVPPAWVGTALGHSCDPWL